MVRRWISIAALVVGVALLLVLVGVRIGERGRVVAEGERLLMALAPFGPSDMALGDRVDLLYDLPAIAAELRTGRWPGTGTLRVTRNDGDVFLAARLEDGSPLAGRELLLNYRHAPSGPGLWPSDRPRLSFGDSFFLVTEGRIADYLGARYAVLRVDRQGNSVVTDLADADGGMIRPPR